MRRTGILVSLWAVWMGLAHAASIDREALVNRHEPTLHAVDVDSPFQVGNGGFAFGADITGLQTFAELYHREGVPAETQSRWCWYTDPNPHEYSLADVMKDFRQPDGTTLSLPNRSSTPAGEWLRRNPRIQPLGQIRLLFDKTDHTPLQPADIGQPRQTLHLWTGELESRYEIQHTPIAVSTVCHPDQDTLSFRIQSPAVASRVLGIELGFPRDYDPGTKNTPGYDWTTEDTHLSTLTSSGPQQAVISRRHGDTRYQVRVQWSGSATLTETSPHHFQLRAAAGSPVLEFQVSFSPAPLPAPVTDHASCLQASAVHWQHFWKTTAAVDFTGSTDPRAGEIEKRIILSRYLMAIQMAGDVPPQESGLTCSTWYGKHHSEMIWWHTAHFALWGSPDLLEKNLAWYLGHLETARALARSRGLAGARWAKMTGPDQRESPGGNPLIIWNQPHLVYLSELVYRDQPTPATLEKYGALVEDTATCLASMAKLDPQDHQYHLGPPLWIAQEIYDPVGSRDPGFELSYWRWALKTAQLWRTRQGKPRDPHWDDVIFHLAPLPVKDGKYVALASQPDTFDRIESRHDHPTMLAPLGVLPGEAVDPEVMRSTLHAVIAEWDWQTKIWGWDYPMITMTATRLGEPEKAIEILMRPGPNNRYLPNGQCPQRSDEALPPNPPPGARKREIASYLPANGAFLSAVALMIAGWDGCTTPTPGFPKDGRWAIRAEGLKELP